MKILLLAPHPFYQARGTPIAANCLLQVLSERGEQVDVVTYREGQSVSYRGVTIHRIPAPPFIRNIRPGFSVKKVLCDLVLLVTALRLRAKHRYDVTHCIEESVFIGMLIKAVFGTPYIYDMDSLLSEQLVERYPFARSLTPLLNMWERWAIRGALAIVPVCEALAQQAERFGPARIVILHDVSLLSPGAGAPADRTAGTSDVILLYVGNLEPYQGIGLLLESFARASRVVDEGRLRVIGGTPDHLARYRRHAQRLGIGERVEFLGPQPVEALGDHLRRADILVSPRIQGRNTPMKIYSYLDAGRAILATNLPTHTQVLTPEVSVLAEPSPEAMAEGMVRLMMDATLRERLGQAGRRLVETRYTYDVFRASVEELYEGLGAEPVGARS